MNTQEINVSLPSDIIYVSGTVNSKAYTWTLVDAAWQAIADRADDETYLVALTAINAAGTSASYEFTLYYGLLNLITDRTQADVDLVKALSRKRRDTFTEEEQAAWDASLKGAYNATDMNRVGSAINYVAGRLIAEGYNVQVQPKIDWTVADIPTPAQLDAYLADVATIRAALAVYAETPEVPADMEKLTFAEANDIERILLDVDALITNMMQAWYYAGEIYSGEV
jgi:hypothetical protein